MSPIRLLLLLLVGTLCFHSPRVFSNDLPPAIRSLESKGMRIIESFDAPNGLQGYIAEHQGRGVALYLLPDGQHILSGHLLDADGTDLSLEPLERLYYAPLHQQLWQDMADSAWIADGSGTAPRIVYVFTDPNCPYCTLFWEDTRPWVERGKVQVRHIMIGIIRPDSIPKAAALLGADDPAAALHAHESDRKKSMLLLPDALLRQEIPEGILKKLDGNHALMKKMNLSSSPVIFYLDGDGRLQRYQGAPAPDDLLAIMGPLD